MAHCIEKNTLILMVSRQKRFVVGFAVICHHCGLFAAGQTMVVQIVTAVIYLVCLLQSYCFASAALRMDTEHFVIETNENGPIFL